ncbi:hypothetical protein LIER_16568 [Lithospermum erythrorhizon]|uniref:Uncharacterized protein n=1 Tax=Lithospermum erythrorhizon TaxID=34254 RepID=A0AAV3QBL0_LITER
MKASRFPVRPWRGRLRRNPSSPSSPQSRETHPSKGRSVGSLGGLWASHDHRWRDSIAIPQVHQVRLKEFAGATIDVGLHHLRLGGMLEDEGALEARGVA